MQRLLFLPPGHSVLPSKVRSKRDEAEVGVKTTRAGEDEERFSLPHFLASMFRNSTFYSQSFLFVTEFTLSKRVLCRPI